MAPRPTHRLPRLLFRVALALSAVLLVAVAAAPLLDRGESEGDGAGRLLTLFARDPALRRTAVACALGMAVTACTFFRPSGRPPRAVGRRRKGSSVPPPPTVAGA